MHRNAAGFRGQIFVSCKNFIILTAFFFLESLGISAYKIILSTNRHYFNSLFKGTCLYFLLSDLSGWNFVTIRNSGERGVLGLVPLSSRKSVPSFLIEYDDNSGAQRPKSRVFHFS